MGRVTGLGREPELDEAKSGWDIVKLKFRTPEDLHRGGLSEFLAEHLQLFLGKS